jgi:hypothetical protein
VTSFGSNQDETRGELQVDQGQRQRKRRQVAFSAIPLRQPVAQCILITSIEPDLWYQRQHDVGYLLHCNRGI